MKILKKILIVLVVIIGLVMIVSIFLPGKVVISRTRVMQAPKEAVFEKINVLQKWPKWMTWAKLDPNAVYTYSADPAMGKGAWYTWKGNKDMGEGKMTITEVYGTDSINMDLQFADYPPNPVQFKLFEKEKGTEVVWNMTMEFPFYMRIMGLFMDGMMAADFEGGLEGIEKLAISEPTANAGTAYEFAVEETTPMKCVIITDSCSVADPKLIGEKMGAAYGQLMEELKAQKAEPVGPAFSVTQRYDQEKQFMVFSPGLPVAAEVKNIKNKKVKYGEFPVQKALVYNYFGDYAKMEPLYEAMYKHIGENKMEVVGPSWEVYMNDPMVEKDTAKWNTKVYIPIK